MPESCVRAVSNHERDSHPEIAEETAKRVAEMLIYGDETRIYYHEAKFGTR